jgi:FAD synthase
LYGQCISVELYERLRPELRFETADDLIEQMHKDVDDVRSRTSSFAPSDDKVPRA